MVFTLQRLWGHEIVLFPKWMLVINQAMDLFLRQIIHTLIWGLRPILPSFDIRITKTRCKSIAGYEISAVTIV